MVPVSFFEQLIKFSKLLFSSPVYIGLFVIFILLFLFQFLNVKRENIVVKIGVSCLFFGFMLFAILGYHKAILTGLDYMMEQLILNLYFPSLTIYIVVLIFSYLIFLLTTFSTKFSKTVKRINSSFFTMMQFLFSIFLIIVITEKIDISSRINIYQSTDLTVILQLSMILLVFWLLSLVVAYYIKQIKKYFFRKLEK